MPDLITNYWFVLIISLLISGAASLYVKLMYAKYDKIGVSCGITANEFAGYVMERNGVSGVSITHVGGKLSDYYSNGDRTLALSDSTYGRSSVAAIGVAAHEAGHAAQYARNYGPVHLRTAMVPAVNIGSNLGLILAIIGAAFNSSTGDLMVNIGILLYSLTFVFTVVTLPVEFNASRRAIQEAGNYPGFSREEVAGMRRVLTAAALTYVAAMVTSLLNLLRIIAVFGGGRRRNR